jgi:hypothetical protein
MAFMKILGALISGVLGLAMAMVAMVLIALAFV